jgi:SAM-dependent methyltransferase
MKLPPMSYVSRERFLVEAVRGKKVLHLGFVGDRVLAPGERSLHEHLLKVAAELWGVDLDRSGVAAFIERHPEAASRTFVGDACALHLLPINDQFEMIIAGDLIEHLLAPKTLLDSCERMLAPGGRVLLTTPNALGLLNVLRAYNGTERVNPRHTLWFSVSTLQEFARQSDWSVESHRTGYDFEPKRASTRLKYRLGAAFFRRFPQWGGTLISILRPNGTGAMTRATAEPQGANR